MITGSLLSIYLAIHPFELWQQGSILSSVTNTSEEIMKLSTTALPLPTNWESYTYEEIGEHFNCNEQSHDVPRDMYTNDDWYYLQDMIKKYVDNNVSFDDEVLPTDGYTLSNGEPTPFYAKHTEGKGRGLYASRDIKSGELVHDGEDTNSDIVFPDSLSFRRLLFNLPKLQACDMQEWPWTMRLEEDGPLRIVFSPNISIYMNSGYGEEPGNVLPASETSRKMYAVRDIKKDEEIITNYSEYYTDWEEAFTGIRSNHYDVDIDEVSDRLLELLKALNLSIKEKSPSAVVES